MIKTIYIKEFTYKKEKYKFIKPLRIVFHNFLTQDCTKTCGELSIPEVLAGYTRSEPFNIEDEKELEKEYKAYLKTVWDEYLLNTNLTDEYDKQYRENWINLLKKPKDTK